MAPPRPSSSARPSAARPNAKPTSALAEDPYAVTTTEAAYVVKPSPPKPSGKAPARPSTPPRASSKRPEPVVIASAHDEADTVHSLPDHLRSSIADLAERVAKRSASSPTPSKPAPAKPAPPAPASVAPAAPPSMPVPPAPRSVSVAPPLPVPASSAKLPPPPASSRPGPRSVAPPPPASSRPATLAPSPMAVIHHVPSTRPVPAPASVREPAPVAPVLAPLPAPISTLRGFGPGGAPLAPGSSSPFAAPPTFAPSSSNPVGVPTVPLARPSTPKAFVPDSGEAVPASAPPRLAYERAFRSWSSSNLPESDDPSGPLTYQVFRPSDVAPPRSVSLERIAEESALAAKTPSLASRMAIVVAGLLTVFATAGIISFASNDEGPARQAAKAVGAAAPRLPATSITTTTLLDVAPPPVATAAPVVVVEAASTPTPARTVAAKPAPPAPSASAKTTKPGRVATLAADPWTTETSATPASLRTVTPPPNPYGGTPSSVLRAPRGYKR